jgi:hypothetical protein
LIWFRFVFGGLLLAAIFCFGAAIVTRDPKWRRRGVTILTWTVVAAVVFFGALLATSLRGSPTP